MTRTTHAGRRARLVAAGLALALAAPLARATDPELFAASFDAHWERLRDEYPYFELYGVDWDAERAEHRPRAVGAADADAFAWELARLVAALPDPHVAFLPSVDVMRDRWAVPDVKTALIDRRPFALSWPEGAAPEPPAAFADDPFAYPEIVGIEGIAAIGAAQILAAGPVGTSFDLRLRWPDGSEQDHTLRRPAEPNLPPPESHYGEGWLIVGRVGRVGYMRVRTFDPDRATLGPDGKLTTMLRAALRELDDTAGLVLDLQGNGGGLVAASDPFLGNLVERRLSYRWGNSGGKRRVIRPRRPRYEGDVVVIVDEGSASGGEWAARILRDAGRAVVVGGRTSGAEAAVHESLAPDGSKVMYSAWPMVEPGRTPFQEAGITLDHALPLTLEAVRAVGIDAAREQVRRARYVKALELLGAPVDGADRLMALADSGEAEDDPTR